MENMHTDVWVDRVKLDNKAVAWLELLVELLVSHEPRHHARLNAPVKLNCRVILLLQTCNMYMFCSVFILVFFVAQDS